MSRRQGRECIHVVRDFLIRWNDATADQKQVLLALAAFAPDIRPGHAQLCALIGIHKSKIRPAIAYWLALKILVLVNPGRPKNAAVYRVDLAQIASLLGSPVEPSAEPDSVHTVELSQEAHSVQNGAPLGSDTLSTRFTSRTTRGNSFKVEPSRKAAPVGASNLYQFLGEVSNGPPYGQRNAKQKFARSLRVVLAHHLVSPEQALRQWQAQFPSS